MTRYPEDQWPEELRNLSTAEHPGDGRRLVPTQAVCDLFCCGPSNLREMRRRGRLAATVYRQGNTHFYDLEDVAAAYLDRFPLKVIRGGPPEPDGVDVVIDGLAFLQRRREREEAASERASEVAQSDRQGTATEMGKALAAALAPLIEQAEALRQESVRKTETIDAQQKTIESQRAEIERLTRASEERQQSGWRTRLWGKR